MEVKNQKLPFKTQNLLNDFLELPFIGEKITCPYWVNDLANGIRGPYSGKGTPKQIVAIAYRKAKKLKIDLDKLDKDSLRKFLEENRIGIDCSGFVFHLLNIFDKDKGGNGITRKYLRYSKISSRRASWKLNADSLTSEEFTRKVKLNNVRPGDVIRLLRGNHIAFIVEVKRSFITYAHSSNYTKERGCHLGKIIIKDWNKELENQEWDELAGTGIKYKEVTFFPRSGDSIRRPRLW